MASSLLSLFILGLATHLPPPAAADVAAPLPRVTGKTVSVQSWDRKHQSRDSTFGVLEQFEGRPDGRDEGSGGGDSWPGLISPRYLILTYVKCNCLVVGSVNVNTSKAFRDDIQRSIVFPRTCRNELDVWDFRGCRGGRTQSAEPMHLTFFFLLFLQCENVAWGLGPEWQAKRNTRRLFIWASGRGGFDIY